MWRRLSSCRAVCVAPSCLLGTMWVLSVLGGTCQLLGTDPFLFPSLGQASKTEKEIAQEKCALEKELAKNKVPHISFVGVCLIFLCVAASSVPCLHEQLATLPCCRVSI